ncbi:uncharacterized protein FFB14_15589 [Fusarium fujikuroi]|nr:uncharacterized protein FFB14_15589 [Fusarium fujikuroi]
MGLFASLNYEKIRDEYFSCLFPEPEQGFAGNEEGFPDPEEGFPNLEEGFPDPGTEEGFPEPETGFPEPDTEEGDLGPPSCPAAFAGLDIETAVRDSMEFCCPDASADHEALIKEYMAIVNSALNLIGRYCDKSCEPPGPLCFGLPLNPELIQIVDATASLKDLPQSSLAKENHVFDFDTLLGPVKPGFELYKSRRSTTPIQRPFGRTFYRIREGAELVIDFSAFDKDMVLSVADVYDASEQLAVFVNGEEIGRAHGALSLKSRGKDPYEPANVPFGKVGGVPDGPAKCLIGRGFWGSFKIPKGSKSVVVKMIHSPQIEGTAAYRIDNGCNN